MGRYYTTHFSNVLLFFLSFYFIWYWRITPIFWDAFLLSRWRRRYADGPKRRTHETGRTSSTSPPLSPTSQPIPPSSPRPKSHDDGSSSGSSKRWQLLWWSAFNDGRQRMRINVSSPPPFQGA